MRITIVGAGAIGGTAGAFLARGGEEVLFVDVVKEHVDAINQRGLTITGRAEFTVPVRATTPDAMRGPLEWVFLSVKSQHTEAALKPIAPLLGPQSFVVSLQNGLNEERIAALIGRERTVGAHVNFGSDYLAPGLIQYGSEGTFYVGELDGSITDRVRALNDLLCKFTEVVVTQNIWGYKWGKQCWASLNYATALVDADAGDILADPRNRRVGVALLAESVELARLEGVKLEAFDGFEPDLMTPTTPAAWEAAMDSIDKMADEYWRPGHRLKKRTGIWRDLVVRKRKTEVDYRIGELVRRGRARGLAMPLNAALWRMIHEIEEGKRPMVPENLRELERMIK
ncbi:MAG TPA: 2-dehydropantoate 2-reductase [Candidatus Methylomirabilis sp.]|nr:2-dehydropantoate 2-reductase [Candidatus Methylomirabilis sp.]